MAEEFNFEQALARALDEKAAWVNSKVMPVILDNYRILYSAANNVMGSLLQKGLIAADPYKLEKKFSDVTVPEEGEFTEFEQRKVLGERLSDYERVLDFLCNSFKFSTQNLVLPRIKKLVALNNCFQWGGLVITSKQPNTRGLASLVNAVRRGGDSMTIISVNGAITSAAKSIVEINGALKQTSDLQREMYKMKVRKTVVTHASFSWAKGDSIPETVQKIKQLFPPTMGRLPFYPELVEELVLESIAPGAIQRQQALLERLKIVQETEEKKRVQINTKALIMEAVRNLAGLAPQLELAITKLRENNFLLQSQYNTPWEKFKRAFRKAFGLKPPVIEYSIPIMDAMTKTTKNEKIEFSKSIFDIIKRMHFYNSLASRESLAYQKIESQTEPEIYSFLTKQLSECQQMLTLLMAYDKFFKSEVQSPNKSKVKGLSMETTAIKNTMVKTNQRKAEYAAYVEEQQQMKRLGILDED